MRLVEAGVPWVADELLLGVMEQRLAGITTAPLTAQTQTQNRARLSGLAPRHHVNPTQSSTSSQVRRRSDLGLII